MGIHWTELVVVAFVALLIFGPKRLPEIGGAVGRTYREFKKSLGEVADLTYVDVPTGHWPMFSRPAELAGAIAAAAAQPARAAG